jgi:hypothetical protein
MGATYSLEFAGSCSLVITVSAAVLEIRSDVAGVEFWALIKRGKSSPDVISARRILFDVMFVSVPWACTPTTGGGILRRQA